MAKAFTVKAICTPQDDKMPGYLFVDVMDTFHALLKFSLKEQVQQDKCPRRFNLITITLENMPASTTVEDAVKKTEELLRFHIPPMFNLQFSGTELFTNQFGHAGPGGPMILDHPDVLPFVPPVC